MAAPKVLVAADALRASGGAICSPHAGASPRTHRRSRTALVWANLRGIESHGVSRVPRYLELFDKGQSDPTRPGHGRAAAARRWSLVDAHTAPGPVAMTRAAREVVDRAARDGDRLGRRARHRPHRRHRLLHEPDRRGRDGWHRASWRACPTWPTPAGAAAGVATSPLSVAVPGGARGTGAARHGDRRRGARPAGADEGERHSARRRGSR